MFFDVRTLHTAKDQEYAAEYEDAFQVDGERGLASIADGVSSAIFSRQWARILTQGTVDEPPDLYAEGSLESWLEQRRQEWLTTIDIPNLPWNKRRKLQQVGGAFSTLLWIELYEDPPVDTDREEPAADQESDEPKPYRLRCFAVGDCSLFHVREGEILRSFPLTDAASFDADPISICSVNLNRDHCLEFSAMDEYCQSGDLLVLCTDAIGKWAMTRIEADDPPNWETYWDMPSEDWLEEITNLRTERQMRYDDTTLVLLKVGVEPEEKLLDDETELATAVATCVEDGCDATDSCDPADAAIETAVYMSDCEPASDAEDWLQVDEVRSVLANADDWEATSDLFVETGQYPIEDDGAEEADESQSSS